MESEHDTIRGKVTVLMTRDDGLAGDFAARGAGLNRRVLRATSLWDLVSAVAASDPEAIVVDVGGDTPALREVGTAVRSVPRLASVPLVALIPGSPGYPGGGPYEYGFRLLLDRAWSTELAWRAIDAAFGLTTDERAPKLDLSLARVLADGVAHQLGNSASVVGGVVSELLDVLQQTRPRGTLTRPQQDLFEAVLGILGGTAVKIGEVSSAMRLMVAASGGGSSVGDVLAAVAGICRMRFADVGVEVDHPVASGCGLPSHIGANLARLLVGTSGLLVARLGGDNGRLAFSCGRSPGSRGVTLAIRAEMIPGGRGAARNLGKKENDFEDLTPILAEMRLLGEYAGIARLDTERGWAFDISIPDAGIDHRNDAGGKIQEAG